MSKKCLMPWKVTKVSMNIKNLRPIALLNSPMLYLFLYAKMCHFIPCVTESTDSLWTLWSHSIDPIHLWVPLTPVPEVNKNSQNEWMSENNTWYYFHITIPELMLRNSCWHIMDFGSKVLCLRGSGRVMHTPKWVKVSRWLQSHQQAISFI